MREVFISTLMALSTLGIAQNCWANLVRVDSSGHCEEYLACQLDIDDGNDTLSLQGELYRDSILTISFFSFQERYEALNLEKYKNDDGKALFGFLCEDTCCASEGVWADIENNQMIFQLPNCIVNSISKMDVIILYFDETNREDLIQFFIRIPSLGGSPFRSSISEEE